MLQTVGLLAPLAIEMDMQVVIDTVVMAMSQLIAYAVTSVFDDMY